MTITPSTWIGGSEIGPKVIGVSPIGSGSARVSPADRDRRQPAQDGAEADGRHDDGDDRPAQQRPQHDALEREAEQRS